MKIFLHLISGITRKINDFLCESNNIKCFLVHFSVTSYNRTQENKLVLKKKSLENVFR